MRGSVVIPKRDERSQLQEAFRSEARRVNIVFDYRRILAVNHKEALFDFDALDVIDEGRERIEPEFLEIAMSLRMYRAGILVGREIVKVAVDQQSFFELRKENHATHRRLRRCGQQAVIAARVHADDG